MVGLIPGMTANPDGPRTTQQTRNLLMDPGDSAADFRFLVRTGRAGQFTASSGALLASAGIEAVKIAPSGALARMPIRKVRAHGPDRGHRPDADLRPAASADDPSPSTGPITTDVVPIAAASSTRPGPATRPPASPRSESSVGPSLAAVSANTSDPPKNPGQDWWPSSGTPQVAAHHAVVVSGQIFSGVWLEGLRWKWRASTRISGSPVAALPARPGSPRRTRDGPQSKQWRSLGS